MITDIDEQRADDVPSSRWLENWRKAFRLKFPHRADIGLDPRKQVFFFCREKFGKPLRVSAGTNEDARYQIIHTWIYVDDEAMGELSDRFPDLSFEAT